MKTSSQIRFDFQNALSQAQKLEKLANQINRSIAADIEQNAQRLHSAWTGDSANRYIQKEAQLAAQTRQSAEELLRIASDIRRIARQVYNAEMQALQIAQQRSSGGGGGGGGR